MIEVNKSYTIGSGFYKGEKITVLWINPKKTITLSNGKRYTQVHGLLYKPRKRINVIGEFLLDNIYDSMSKLELIKKIKKKDLKAKKEYIIRYKKVPKI